MKQLKPIVFWAFKNRPSFYMRGNQLAEALTRLGYNVSLRLGPSHLALRDVRDSIIVCVISISVLFSFERRWMSVLPWAIR